MHNSTPPSQSPARCRPAAPLTSRLCPASEAPAMESFTAYFNLRGPSPIVRAMGTCIDRPPPLAEPIPFPIVYPPPRPPLPPPAQPEMRRRGRPRKQDSLPPPPGFGPSPAAPRLPAPPPAMHAHRQEGLRPHMLTIAAGEDIISRIMAVSQMDAEAICVRSALGAIMKANLLHSSGVVVNHKGPLEILRFGSILAPKSHGLLRVTLASADSSVIGGIVAGPLIAATSVQAVVGTFHGDAYWPNMAPRVTTSSANSQFTISNGITLSSERTNPGYASCTLVEQNGSSDIDFKPSLGVGYSTDINVKPSLGVGYTSCTSVDDIDMKPSVGAMAGKQESMEDITGDQELSPNLCPAESMSTEAVTSEEECSLKLRPTKRKAPPTAEDEDDHREGEAIGNYEKDGSDER